MDERLYDLCDWAEIETIVYSEHDNPHAILGAHKTEDGILINTFIPKAVDVKVKLTKTNKEYPMELADDEGFYAVLIPGKRVVPYTYLITFDNGTAVELCDPYNFDSLIDESDMKKFAGGIHYDIYNKLGAHVKEIQGIQGVHFAVWAPNAVRVSVVGDFNIWDGRRHPMRRLKDSGIFELFIPGLMEGDIYKYEIKIPGGLIVLKSDPYGYYSELRPATASVVKDINHFQWTDEAWLKHRKSTDYDRSPMAIYEVHLGSFKKPDEEGRDFYNYRELAPMLTDYIKEMGYTHVELMPIMEHPFDASWGYQVTGYYAPTSRYGTPDDFMYLVDYLHQNEIGVIFDWVPAHFPRDTFGLANFDGTCLYEHLDPRQGSHPHWGTLIYNYGRPQVSNFLIANALFWVDKYHADGIRMDAVASMLYLDYGKNDGEWVANIYGGNENLEAIEFLKHLNSVFKSKKTGAFVIAEESTAWPKICGAIDDGGLGFQYKWNMGWMNDFTNYMKTDPLFRNGKHGELTFSLIYAYSEKFILVLSHDEVVHGKGSMINKMPGEYHEKFNNLRVAYGFMMTHPGKKLLFMGQDFAQFSEWSEEKSLDWGLLEYESHRQMRDYMKELFRLYKENKALYELDFDSDGFEWVNDMDSERSIVSFLRKTAKDEDTLLVVCNFTPVVYENYAVGVPFKGKYKETFNSDNVLFGGEGHVNPRLKQSKDMEVDGRVNSIRITVPPMGIAVFTCKPTIPETKTVKNQGALKKTAVNKSEQKENSNLDRTDLNSNSEGILENKTEKSVSKDAEAKIIDKAKTLVKKAVQKVGGKALLNEEITRIEDKEDKAVPKEKIEDKQKPKEKIEDKQKPKAKIEDKQKPKDKIEDKQKPKDKIEDKREPRAKIADKAEPRAKIADKTEPKIKIEDKLKPKEMIEETQKQEEINSGSAESKNQKGKAKAKVNTKIKQTKKTTKAKTTESKERTKKPKESSSVSDGTE